MFEVKYKGSDKTFKVYGVIRDVRHRIAFVVYVNDCWSLIASEYCEPV